MEKVNITITVPRRTLDRLLEIGNHPYGAVVGTDLVKEYNDLKKDIGTRAIMKYKDSGADPA